MHFFCFSVSIARVCASVFLFYSIRSLLLTVLLQINNYACTTKTGVPFSGHRFRLSKNLAGAAKESASIFFGDMCGEENTARPANVRAVRLRRTARALQSGR